MKWCFLKMPYVVWDGSNLDEVREHCAPILELDMVTVDGDTVHITRPGAPMGVTLTPGMVLVGWSVVLSAEDFEHHYGRIEPQPGYPDQGTK